MLTFKKFLEESERTGSAANTNGVRHELIMAGVLNHMSKHHEDGSEHNLFHMNDKQLRDHFDTHVRSGAFAAKHMPEHFRDKENQTPAVAHDRYTSELSADDHFKHFRNAVHHAKELHAHLEKRGYDPKTLKHVAWTSVDGAVNSFMKKHGNNPNRRMNKSTDDPDVMATIKDKDGNRRPIGLSLKWGSKKHKKPTAKNNTLNTVITPEEVPKQHHDAIEEYKQNAKKENDEHKATVKRLYPAGTSDEKRKHLYDADKMNTHDEEAQNRVKAADASYDKKGERIAHHLHTALNKINSGENGHEEISNFIRRKLQIKNPDFVAARAHMTVNKQDNVDSHHFEDHSTSLNDHLHNAHKFHIERNGSTVNIHALDKDGKKLFTHKMWTKGNSRKSDTSTKWLHSSS